jgi:hypothetical protein
MKINNIIIHHRDHKVNITLITLYEKYIELYCIEDKVI